MLLLRSHASAWRYAQVEPDANTIRILPLWKGIHLRRKKTVGWYEHLGGSLVAIYCLKGALQLSVNGKTVAFDERIEVQVTRVGSQQSVRVAREGNSLFESSYPYRRSVSDADMTAGVEEEHFDFGLFLQNLARDPSRRLRLCAR